MAGKGGVGKSTVGATIGVAAANSGYDVLVVELEGYSSLGALLSTDSLGYEETVVTSPALTGNGRLRARQIVADSALNEYLDASIVGPVARALGSTGAVEIVATAAPGIRDLLALGKIRQIEQAATADLVIVDAPASGHALTFLAAPAAIASSTSSGPLREQADLAIEMMADDKRCQVLLVTVPEETPISETVETAFSLEDTVDMKLGPIVVNGLWPEIPGLAEALDQATDASTQSSVGEEQTSKKQARKRQTAQAAAKQHQLEAAAFRLQRQASQERQVRRLEVELPLPQIQLPFLFTTELSAEHLAELADHFTAAVSELSDQAGGS